MTEIRCKTVEVQRGAEQFFPRAGEVSCSSSSLQESEEVLKITFAIEA